MNFAVNTLMPFSFSAMLVNHFLFRFNECRKNLQVGFMFTVTVVYMHKMFCFNPYLFICICRDANVSCNC